jgi:CTP synthase
MDSQREVTHKGGTMRLGAYPAHLQNGTKAAEAYGDLEISERHRHRYEVNPSSRDRLEREGLRISAISPDGKLVEMIELADHPWFVGCQFHPELKSRPTRPHPLFAAFVRAAAREAGISELGVQDAVVGARS